MEPFHSEKNEFGAECTAFPDRKCSLGESQHASLVGVLRSGAAVVRCYCCGTRA